MSYTASISLSAKRLPRNVVALGCVSLLMATSSQMIHGLLPLFLTTVLDGAVSLVASAGAGVVWLVAGSTATFTVGAAVAAAVLLMLAARPLDARPTDPAATRMP